MTHTKRLLALLLCLILLGTSSVALAASKTFTTAPTLKASMPKGGVVSYTTKDYTVTPSQPGFLTAVLLNESGAEVLKLCENQEVHTKANEFEITAKLPDGEPLPAGDYTVRIDFVNQFGLAAKTLDSSLKVLEMDEAAQEQYAIDHEPKAEDVPAVAETNSAAADAETDAADQNETGSAAGVSASASSSASSASPASSASSSASGVAYASGTSVTSDEGLLIGVGVSDIATQTEAGYWSLTADATDEQIWAALTRDMVGVDAAENESAYIYDSPEEDRKKLGTVSGISHGLNVIVDREDGWSLVEAFRNEDGAFVRGYIKTNKLRPVTPNQTYGLVIDKAEQTLTVYKDGERLGSCKVSTGLATSKYLHRETPAGEFITVTRRGSYEYYGNGYTKYTIRINGNYYLAEIPTTKKNGSTFMDVGDHLGSKASRGTVLVAHDASSDGGINAEWIWNMTDENKRVKVLIFDDKARTDVPVGE